MSDKEAERPQNTRSGKIPSPSRKPPKKRKAASESDKAAEDWEFTAAEDSFASAKFVSTQDLTEQEMSGKEEDTTMLEAGDSQETEKGAAGGQSPSTEYRLQVVENNLGNMTQMLTQLADNVEKLLRKENGNVVERPTGGGTRPRHNTDQNVRDQGALSEPQRRLALDMAQVRREQEELRAFQREQQELAAFQADQQQQQQRGAGPQAALAQRQVQNTAANRQQRAAGGQPGGGNAGMRQPAGNAQARAGQLGDGGNQAARLQQDPNGPLTEEERKAYALLEKNIPMYNGDEPYLPWKEKCDAAIMASGFPGYQRPFHIRQVMYKCLIGNALKAIGPDLYPSNLPWNLPVEQYHHMLMDKIDPVPIHFQATSDFENWSQGPNEYIDVYLTKKQKLYGKIPRSVQQGVVYFMEHCMKGLRSGYLRKKMRENSRRCLSVQEFVRETMECAAITVREAENREVPPEDALGCRRRVLNEIDGAQYKKNQQSIQMLETGVNVIENTEAVNNLAKSTNFKNRVPKTKVPMKSVGQKKTRCFWCGGSDH